VVGADASMPTVRIQTALTMARQAFGWSGMYMQRQLRQARLWHAAEAQQQLLREDAEYQYDGWELDDPQDRPLISDFVNNAKWFVHYKVKDRTRPGLMLKQLNNRYWRKDGVYTDRVGAARYFIKMS
jgi:hypothetical protein